MRTELFAPAAPGWRAGNNTFRIGEPPGKVVPALWPGTGLGPDGKVRVPGLWDPSLNVPYSNGECRYRPCPHATILRHPQHLADDHVGFSIPTSILFDEGVRRNR